MAKHKEEENDPNITKATYLLLGWIIFAFGLGIWLESFIVGIIAISIGIGHTIHFVMQKSIENSILERPNTMRYRPEGEGNRTLRDSEYFCDIAGVGYHATFEGSFVGFVCRQPDNPYDSKALAVCTNLGLIVGYIPRYEQEQYNEWTDRDGLPCIGYLTEGYNGKLRGKVKVVDADRNLTELHIIKFAIWLIENHGSKYIPPEFKEASGLSLRTEEEWLDYLDKELERRTEIRKEIDKKMKLIAKELAKQAAAADDSADE